MRRPDQRLPLDLGSPNPTSSRLGGLPSAAPSTGTNSCSGLGKAEFAYRGGRSRKIWGCSRARLSSSRTFARGRTMVFPLTAPAATSRSADEEAEEEERDGR